MKVLFYVFVLMFSIITLNAQSNDVEYTVDGKSYQGYFEAAKNSKVLIHIVHDWDGLTDYEIKRAKMLAEQGYSVFAADLFGKGVKADTMEIRQKLTGELYSNRAKMRKLLNAAVTKAEELSKGKQKVFIAGYCFGGAAVLELARSGASLDGFFSFHGGLTTPEGQNYSSTKSKVVVFHGTADTSVSMDDFATLAKELESAGVKHEMITYSGAPHAFTVFGSSRYQEEADKKSWQRFLEIIKEER